MMQRILIIGAGFAGLWSALAAARRLEIEGSKDGAIEVALIAPEPILTIRPRLYEAAPDDMTASLENLFEETGVRYIQGSVETIRANTDEVDYINASGERLTLSYHRLVMAAGSKLFRPDIPGLRQYAFSVDQRDEAAALDVHLKNLAQQPASLKRDTVIVAGGGFTGLEIATELPGRLKKVLGSDANIRIMIVERADAIGPGLGSGPRPVIDKALSELGIEYRLGSAVAVISADGLKTADGEYIEAGTIIWTAGVRANALTAQISAERDELGRLRVDHDLRVPSAPKIFAAGDAAVAPTDDQGNHTLMSCQHAIPAGKSAGDNAAADLLGQRPTPYSQPHYVTCLDLGSAGAVVTRGRDRKIWLTGAEGKTMKMMINGTLIYPPADRDAAFAAADPQQALSL
ncbi:FAD-dependent oxidoreductase [Phyllobacterium sophorae]|uniref:FAD-dependent oxidoreductase n=2 Tax=Phyllobacterium sophorae TaxID=1520277 RepID=A0A2P7B4Z2_9HYPH|nr:FAD-dependent oxidoreductase [Phyllobacterium sophorae]